MPLLMQEEMKTRKIPRTVDLYYLHLPLIGIEAENPGDGLCIDVRILSLGPVKGLLVPSCDGGKPPLIDCVVVEKALCRRDVELQFCTVTFVSQRSLRSGEVISINDPFWSSKCFVLYHDQQPITPIAINNSSGHFVHNSTKFIVTLPHCPSSQHQH
jgi:hypothetical protein